MFLNPFIEDPKPENDLALLSFDHWIDFVFDRPIKEEGEKEWYWQDEFDKYYFVDAPALLGHFIKLLNAPGFLLAKFSEDQIEQGFWCLEMAFEWCELLHSTEVPFDNRKRCIDAIPSLYENLFARMRLSQVAYMLWDNLAYDYFMQKGIPQDNDDLAVQNAMFGALSKIIGMPQRICFLAAIHGLGHLKHPDIAEAIKAAVNGRTDLLDGDREYAQHCIAGTMDRTGGPQFPFGVEK